MAVEIKKNLMGKYIVVYECPGCKERLRSSKDDIGQSDICPTCQTQYLVPGLREWEALLQREQDAIDRKDKLAADKKAAEKQAQQAAKELKKAKEDAAKRAALELQKAKEQKQRIDEIGPYVSRPALPQPSPRQSVSPTSHTGTRRCPYCAEEIQPSAKKCKHCGEFLDGRSQAPQIVVQPVEKGMNGCTMVFVIAFGIIAAVFIMALL